MMAQHAVKFLEPGTDSQQPIPAHQSHEYPRFSILPAPETAIAPGRSIDFPISVIGTLLHLREFERAPAWTTASPAATVESKWAEATERFFRLPDEIEVEIAKLATLPRGWDGYNGFPVRSSVAERARRLLKAIMGYTSIIPAIVPLSDGGLQLEWFVGAYEVEIAITPEGTTLVDFECKSDGRVEEIQLADPCEIAGIAPLFRELRR